MIKVLCVGGIAESDPTDTRDIVTGMLKNVTDHLDTAQFESHWVPWIAEYGPVPQWSGLSYKSAISIGEKQVLAAMELYNDSEFILLGYSGGAHVAGNVANMSDKVIGCALIADPCKPVTNWPDGYGILGQRPVNRCWFWEVANPRDIICSCPATSPIRTIADITEGFSVGDEPTWSHTLLNKVYQEWWKQPQADWSSVAWGLAGYMSPYPWGQHTGYDHMIIPDDSGLVYTTRIATVLNTWERWDEKPEVAKR